MERNYLVGKGDKQTLDEKLKMIEAAYWKISKIVSVLVLIIGYKYWTMPYSIVKAVILLIGVAVGTFVAINLLDMLIGLIKAICGYIKLTIRSRRALKDKSK